MVFSFRVFVYVVGFAYRVGVGVGVGFFGDKVLILCYCEVGVGGRDVGGICIRGMGVFWVLISFYCLRDSEIKGGCFWGVLRDFGIIVANVLGNL